MATLEQQFKRKRKSKSMGSALRNLWSRVHARDTNDERLRTISKLIELYKRRDEAHSHSADSESRVIAAKYFSVQRYKSKKLKKQH